MAVERSLALAAEAGIKIRSRRHEDPSTYFGRRFANLILTAGDILGRLRYGHFGDVSQIHYKNSMATSAQTICDAANLGFGIAYGVLETTVSKTLGLEPGRNYHDKKIAAKKLELADMIADYAAFPDSPTYYSRREFHEKHRKEYRQSTDIVPLLYAALPIVPLLINGAEISSLITGSLIALAEMLTVKHTLPPFHIYVNTQMNMSLLREKQRELREQGKEGYELFLQEYAAYQASAAKQ